MREVMQGDASNPKVTMGNNYRPVMQIHQRTVRTNINFVNPVSAYTPPTAISGIGMLSAATQQHSRPCRRLN